MKLPPIEDLQMDVLSESNRRYLTAQWQEKTYRVRIPLFDFVRIQHGDKETADPYVRLLMERIAKGRHEPIGVTKDAPLQ